MERTVNKVQCYLLILLAILCVPCITACGHVKAMKKVSIETHSETINVEQNDAIAVGREVKPLYIRCVGDSLTAGMDLPDINDVVYDGETYPSILYTILCDNGVDTVVVNDGHAGEKTAGIVARLGNTPMVINRDIVFDETGCFDDFDNAITGEFSAELSLPISFSYRGKEHNTIIIGKNEYEIKPQLQLDKTWKTLLLDSPNEPSRVIKAGTPVKLKNDIYSDVNIIFAGNNDTNITIDEFVSMLKNGISTGEKYIIIGPYSAIYNRAGFISGNTEEERRDNYKKRMQAEFGNRFIDLRSEWYSRALQISIKERDFAELSEIQINTIQKKLNKKIIPAEYTYNNKDGELHLNKKGYKVIAEIVFERMKKLGYI